jgi:hypothetical protein
MNGSVSLINGHVDRPMTNYERIMNMSVEEMAEAIGTYVSCESCPARNSCSCSTDVSCDEDVKRWLESEVDAE